MYDVHSLQIDLENASYMENRTSGTIMNLGSLMLFLTWISLPKTPLQQLPLLQLFLVLHLLVQLPSMPFPLLDRNLLEQLLLLPLLLKKLSSSQLQLRTTDVLLVLLQLRLLKTKQTKFTEFKQTYTIMQHKLKEDLVTLAKLELRNDSPHYCASSNICKLTLSYGSNIECQPRSRTWSVRC